MAGSNFMIKTCQNCPEATRCTKLCKEIEDSLIVPGFDADGSVSKEDQKKFISLDNKKDTNQDPTDKLFKIDAGLKYSAETDIEIDWVRTTAQPESAGLNQAEGKILADAIRWSIPRNNLKQRRRFNAFLRCSKIADIAKTANTTKQNIHKQFQTIIKNVGRILKTDGSKINEYSTPLHFKKKVT